MMKRYFFFFLLLVVLPSEGHAQEVFNTVLRNAERVINSPTSSFTNVRINQFKYNGLKYIRKKAFETQENVTAQFLDTQAYYMSEFLTLFFKEILKNEKQPEEVKKQKILLFMDASCSNPLFYDSNKELVDAYINDGNELTPFCLDTDWEKAYLAARSQLKK